MCKGVKKVMYKMPTNKLTVEQINALMNAIRHIIDDFNSDNVDEEEMYVDEDFDYGLCAKAVSDTIFYWNPNVDN